jgi:RNA polymerase sigma-70 factor (ECF subfamily)
VVVSPRTDDTEDVLRRAREGSREALGRLLEGCGEHLLAIIRLRLGPALRQRIESRDVLQSTFLKALGHVEGFRGVSRESLMAWLARIAENEIRDLAAFHGRKRRKADRTVEVGDATELDRLAADLRSETSRIALQERSVRLVEVLERMSEEHREVVVLRQLEELPFAEVGRRMGRSPDACRMLLARAMAVLTMSLETEG